MSAHGNVKSKLARVDLCNYELAKTHTVDNCVSSTSNVLKIAVKLIEDAQALDSNIITNNQ